MSGRNESPAPAEDVYLGLGGNIGDPRAAMRKALADLEARADTRVIGVSPLYRTPPWGKPDQPDFLNAAAHIRTRLDPTALLEVCLDIERSLKRVRGERWGPRPIDIDILIYAQRRIEMEKLSVPHPRMGERAFVLVPLVDIAPDIALSGTTPAALLAALDRTGVERITANGAWWREES